MKLRKLNIELQRWGSNEGKYEGTIEFEGESGGISLVLDPAMSAEFLAFASEAIIRASATTAGNLHAAIQKSVQEARQGAALPA